MNRDEYFMSLALAEAKKGLGRTSPNPCVGAVIVRDDKVIATGYHKKAGTPHAERNAIAAAEQDLTGATIYVTLEPCSHTGRTPPCCEALIENGFSRVVIGMGDPNPLVNGRGIAWLKEAGIEVTCGVLEEDCKALNRPFSKYIMTGIPWVIMKAGISLDGRLNYQMGKSGKITGAESLKRVHELRNITDAILVGSGTARIDNPSLTTRLEVENGRDPLRIVLDSSLSLSPASRIFNNDSSAGTLLFCSEDLSDQKVSEFTAGSAVEIVQVPSSAHGGGLDLMTVLRVLGQRGICSVLVEGGSLIHGAFLAAELYDEAFLFYSPLFAGSAGVSLLAGLNIADRSSAPGLYRVQMERLGDDFLLHGFFKDV